MLLLGSHFCVGPAHNNIVDDNPVVQNLKKHTIGGVMVELAGQSYGQLPLLRTAFRIWLTFLNAPDFELKCCNVFITHSELID